MDEFAVRTDVATNADNVALALNTMLGKMRLAPADYVPELTKPTEPSTGGGLRARQHLRLVPRKAGNPTLVIGNVHVKEKNGELRSFVCVDRIYRKQFGGPVPLVRAEYNELVAKLSEMLKQSDIAVTVRETPEADDFDGGTPVRSRGPLLAALAVAALAVGAIVLFLARH